MFWRGLQTPDEFGVTRNPNQMHAFGPFLRLGRYVHKHWVHKEGVHERDRVQHHLCAYALR